jgi:hypothetical protein
VDKEWRKTGGRVDKEWRKSGQRPEKARRNTRNSAFISVVNGQPQCADQKACGLQLATCSPAFRNKTGPSSYQSLPTRTTQLAMCRPKSMRPMACNLRPRISEQNRSAFVSTLQTRSPAFAGRQVPIPLHVHQNSPTLHCRRNLHSPAFDGSAIEFIPEFPFI